VPAPDDDADDEDEDDPVWAVCVALTVSRERVVHLCTFTRNASLEMADGPTTPGAGTGTTPSEADKRLAMGTGTGTGTAGGTITKNRFLPRSM